MSDRRSWLAAPVAGLTARIGNRPSSSTEPNCPATRTCRFSRPAFITPAPSTAFCAAIWATTWLTSSPSCASRFWEISTNTFSAWAPKTSTLATSGTFSRRWRTRSAWTRVSSRLNPSADSAKIEP